MDDVNNINIKEPRKKSHKGQNGKLLIISGSSKYHGASIFAIRAAIRFVDLVYFYPGEKDKYLVNAVKHIPEVIVVDEYPEVDCALFGPGLGENFEGEIPNTKTVIDGDGFKYISEIDVPNNSILTPHEMEFKQLFGEKSNNTIVKNKAKQNNCTILKKGTPDIITNGQKIVTNDVHNAGMTKGGTGDALSGLTAALYCNNDAFTSAWSAALMLGNAGEMLKKEKSYWYTTSELIERLPESYRDLKK